MVCCDIFFLHVSIEAICQKLCEEMTEASQSTLRGSDRIAGAVYLKLNSEVGMCLIGFKKICQEGLLGTNLG